MPLRLAKVTLSFRIISSPWISNHSVCRSISNKVVFEGASWMGFGPLKRSYHLVGIETPDKRKYLFADKDHFVISPVGAPEYSGGSIQPRIIGTRLDELGSRVGKARFVHVCERFSPERDKRLFYFFNALSVTNRKLKSRRIPLSPMGFQTIPPPCARPRMTILFPRYPPFAAVRERPRLSIGRALSTNRKAFKSMGGQRPARKSLMSFSTSFAICLIRSRVTPMSVPSDSNVEMGPPRHPNLAMAIRC